MSGPPAAQMTGEEEDTVGFAAEATLYEFTEAKTWKERGKGEVRGRAAWTGELVARGKGEGGVGDFMEGEGKGGGGGVSMRCADPRRCCSHLASGGPAAAVSVCGTAQSVAYATLA